MLLPSRFEEDNFLRLSGKRRKRDSGRGTREVVEELTDFGDLRELTRKRGRKEGVSTLYMQEKYVGCGVPFKTPALGACTCTQDGPPQKRKFGGKGKMKKKGLLARLCCMAIISDVIFRHIAPFHAGFKRKH